MSVLPPELSGLLDSADAEAREAAWKRFLETHSRLLLHTARSLGPDHDASMDAYAYLLEQLRRDDFHRLRAYVSDERTKFTTWLVVVARRLCLDHLRQRYGRAQSAGSQSDLMRAVRRHLVDLAVEELDPSGRSGAVAVDDPETELRLRELSHALTDVLGGLEPRDRLLLTLRFDDGLSAREIGQIMGFPTPFHVYRRLTILLGQLRLSLGRRGVEGPRP